MVNDTRKVKIYILKDPDTLEIRYVGKTLRTLSHRLGNHIYNAQHQKHNKHLSNWILKLLSLGKRPIIELIEECENEYWQEREQYWISFYSNLLNLTEGGDGCLGFLHDEEIKEKCRKANLGRKHTTEFKENMSKRLKRKPLSESHKKKIGSANRGKKASAETIKKLSEAHKGIKPSEESRKKLNESIKRWWDEKKKVSKI